MVSSRETASFASQACGKRGLWVGSFPCTAGGEPVGDCQLPVVALGGLSAAAAELFVGFNRSFACMVHSTDARDGACFSLSLGSQSGVYWKPLEG